MSKDLRGAGGRIQSMLDNIHKTIFTVLSTARSHMREFALGLLSESRSAPSGRQPVVQAANLNFESACRLLCANTHPSPCRPLLILNHEVVTYLPFFGGWKTEST